MSKKSWVDVANNGIDKFWKFAFAVFKWTAIIVFLTLLLVVGCVRDAITLDTNKVKQAIGLSYEVPSQSE